ncbi:MAG: PIN-like domain-containing protein, partial [Liquorilactobacillus ghanensis]|uniref:PIN-like domain-containing protein n=1 Tax=Liquorilactobacillus ghanensis TaxID=399370 RepID=UPI0039EB1EFC
ILIKENKKMAELSNHLKKSIHEIDEEMVEKENYTELFFELFSNKIGDPFDQERIKEIEKEGANRYEQELPPGYKDASKDDSHVRTFRNVWYHKKYGDLIIWNQILDYVKENDNLKNVVFVTEDKKADWMYIVHDKKIGPRIELKSELLSKADANLIMLDTNNFLMQVNRNTEKLIQSVSERNNYVHSIDDLHDLRALSYMKNEFIDLRREIFKIENMINKLSENKDKLNYLMEKDNSQIDPNYTKILDKEIRDLNYKRQVMMDRLNQLDKDIHLLELKK